MALTIAKGATKALGISVTGGNTNFPVEGTGQSIINVYQTGNGSNQNAYSVTAGKTFYLMGCLYNGASGNTLEIFKNDGATNITRLISGSAQSVSVTFGIPCQKYTSGQNVVCKATNATIYQFWGFEQ